MNKNVQFFIIFCMINLSLQSSENRPLTLVESIVVGGLSGGLEVAATGQPLSYAMNQKFIQQPCNWRHMYQGGFVNAAGQMPITAMQKVVQVKGTQFAESMQGSSLSTWQKIGISFTAGVAGSCIDTPSNAVQVFKQKPENKGKSVAQACKELGTKGSFRGFTANAVLKEGPFVVGYQILASEGKAFVQKYVDHDLLAEGIGGAASGVVVAIATQPGAVIRGKMQSDPYGQVYTSTWQTAQKIYQQEGAVGLLKGLPQRGPRVALAIPMYVFYSDQMKKMIMNNE